MTGYHRRGSLATLLMMTSQRNSLILNPISRYIWNFFVMRLGSILLSYFLCLCVSPGIKEALIIRRVLNVEMTTGIQS